MFNPAQEMSSIAFDKILGGALTAVVEAQNNSSLTTVNFIKNVGFENDQNGNTIKPVYVDFKYPKEVSPYIPARPESYYFTVENGGEGYDQDELNSGAYNIDGKNEIKLSFIVNTEGAITAVNVVEGEDKLTANSRLVITGSGDGALGYAYSYMLWTVVIGGLPTMLAMTLAHFLRGEVQARKASAGMMLGGVLNIGLDPLFMFAFNMGFVGAGIATALSNLVSFVFLLIIFLRGGSKSTMSLSPKYFSFRYAGKVFSVGLSAAFTTLLANVSFMVINILAYGYGTQAVSAYGIVKRLDQIPLGISLGLSQGVMPLIAYNYGSGDYARLKKVSIFSWILAAIMAAVCVVLFEALAPYIARVMLDDEATVPLTTNFLRIACTAVPFTSVNALVMYFFQAMGKGTQATILSVCRQGALNIPFLFLMNRLVGLYGMIWVQLIIEVIMLPFMLGMYLFTMKKINSRAGGKAALK